MGILLSVGSYELTGTDNEREQKYRVIQNIFIIVRVFFFSFCLMKNTELATVLNWEQRREVAY
jgi:hypothetical protein